MAQTAVIDANICSVLGPWDLSPYFTEHYLMTHADLAGSEIGSFLSRTLPPQSPPGAYWQLIGLADNFIYATGNIDGITGTLQWPPFDSYDTVSVDHQTFTAPDGSEYFELQVIYGVNFSLLRCWTLMFRGPKHKMLVQRGPGRAPSVFRVPNGSRLETAKLIEDGIEIPKNRYTIKFEGER